MWRDCALFIIWTKAHPCFYAALIFGTWSWEPPKEALASCWWFLCRRIHLIQNSCSSWCTTALWLCSLWWWRREEASIHLQSGFWGCWKNTWLPSELFAVRKSSVVCKYKASDVCKYCNGAVLACGMDERVVSHKYSQLKHQSLLSLPPFPS